MKKNTHNTKTPTTPQLSVVIVNYRTAHLLEKCVAAIERYAQAPYEVIVVNNDSEPLPSTISQASNTSVIQNHKNNGFGAACNRGARQAQGRILCFLNPDALMETDFSGALDYIETHHGIVGPRLRGENHEVQPWSVGCELTLFEIIRSNFGIPCSRALWRSTVQRDVAWVSGAALFCDAALFKKIEGFDEEFFLYYEDVDLCRRARSHGVRVTYMPEISVFHQEGGSVENRKKQKKYYYASQDYYFKKYTHPVTQRLLIFLRHIFHPSLTS